MAQEQGADDNERPWLDALPTVEDLRNALIEEEHNSPSGGVWNGRAPLLDCRYPLHAAAAANDVGAVQLLLQHGAVVDLKSPRSPILLGQEGQETALHVACAMGHLDVVQVLLKQGKAELNAVCGKGWTPFRKAVGGGHARLVLFLLEHYGLSTLENVLLFMIAPAYKPRQRGLVQLLLRHKVNLNARDAQFNTVFHLAAQAKQAPEFLAMLLRQGQQDGIVDLEATNLVGDTPLLGLWRTSQYVAADSEQEDNLLAMSQALIQAGANVHVRQVDTGISLLHVAGTPRRIAFVTTVDSGLDLQTTVDKKGQTALNYRASLNLPLQAYLDALPDHIPPSSNPITCADNEGLLPLHWTCCHCNMPSLQALLQAGALANATYGRFHRTAMHMLVSASGWREPTNLEACVDVLLAHDPGNGLLLDQTDADSEKWTPLHHAAFRGMRVELLNILIQRGANVRQRDAQGRTALHLVGGNYNYPHDARLVGAVDLLLSHSANARTLSKQRFLHQHGFGGISILVGAPFVSVIKTLLAHGADAVDLDNEGNLPFFLAACMEMLDATFVMIQAAAHQGLFKGGMFETTV